MQISISNNILKKKNPFNSYIKSLKKYALPIKKINKEKKLKIKDLIPGLKNINIELEVMHIPKPKAVYTRFGEIALVSNVILKDETGIIGLGIWNKQIDKVHIGDKVKIKNGKVIWFKEEKQLKIGRDGDLRILHRE
jgi:ssDNA-binding replication factor A large subunit